MLLEDIRFVHEDLERLEQGISDRIGEEPKHVSWTSLTEYSRLMRSQIRDRLARDHQIAGFLSRIQEQSQRLKDLYADTEARTKEIQSISTGDPFVEFNKQLAEVKDFHRRYPNEPVENLEKAYKRKPPTEGASATAEVDNMFTGEEAWGKFLDLTTYHEEYLNLPGNPRRLPYLQYLDTFFIFTMPQCPIKTGDKLTDKYFAYVGGLAAYLESFMRRTQPLQDLNEQFSMLEKDFDRIWEADEAPGWSGESSTAGQTAQSNSSEAIFCADCNKEFKNQNVYSAHLTGKKHIKAAEARVATNGNTTTNGTTSQVHRLRQRAVAEREHRISSLTEVLSSIRTDTRHNVERKQGMTEKERQQELEALFADTEEMDAGRNGDKGDSGSESDSEDKIANPLKLPLAWDGKPIPYWLYKLHGLGVEFPCEICGNYVYMGKRAFDKHFTEALHIRGLKCLGITNTTLFREITGIEDAVKLWDKLQKDKKTEVATGDVIQMEDAEGNVMPQKVYYDLQKQGLL